jgi:hypothetical protein
MIASRCGYCVGWGWGVVSCRAQMGAPLTSVATPPRPCSPSCPGPCHTTAGGTHALRHSPALPSFAFHTRIRRGHLPALSVGGHSAAAGPLASHRASVPRHPARALSLPRLLCAPGVPPVEDAGRERREIAPPPPPRLQIPATSCGGQLLFLDHRRSTSSWNTETSKAIPAPVGLVRAHRRGTRWSITPLQVPWSRPSQGLAPASRSFRVPARESSGGALPCCREKSDHDWLPF